MKVYVIGTGRLNNDYNLSQSLWTLGTRDNPAPETAWYQGPSYAVLIDHPTVGWILYDLGSDPRSDELWPEAIANECFWTPVEGETMEEGLAALGLKPADIAVCVLSHMHMDHIGNMRLFADTADFYVSRAEAEHAFCTVMATPDPAGHGFYNRDDVLCPRKSLTYVEEDTVGLFPGIDAYLLPGHTPGVLGLLLHLEKEKDVLLVSDALNSIVNYHGRLPGICDDTAAYRASAKKIKRIEQANDAWVWFGHDIDQFNSLRKIPDFYE
ncbi:N-acyl homoserine lactonase family protein [Rubneribacter sp.]